MSALQINDNGSFKLTTIEDQMSFAQKLIDTRVISETFKTPQQVVIGIQFCKALNLNPMTGLKMMYVVHGKPSLFGDGPLSLIQSAGKLEWIKEFWVDENGDEICFKNKNLKERPYAAICQVKRVGDENVQEDYFTTQDMTLAQIKSPTWNKYERTMLRYRARTQALKSKFADILNGIGIAEYDTPNLPNENVIVEPELIDVLEDQINEIKDLANKLDKSEEDLLDLASRTAKKEFTSLNDISSTLADTLIIQLKQFVTDKN